MVRDCDKDIELNFLPKPEFTIPFVVKVSYSQYASLVAPSSSSPLRLWPDSCVSADVQDFVLKKRLETNGNALLEYQAGFNNPAGDAHTKYFFG